MRPPRRAQGVSEQELLGLGPAAAAPQQDAPSTHHTAASSVGKPNAVEELARAAGKALASGLGDWHLQEMQDAAPSVRDRLLVGPLGPEALANRHGLSEEASLALYGLLHRAAVGFQSEAARLVAGAAHREQLLAGVWRAFAQLWNDSAAGSFRGEVVSMVAELQAAYEALSDTQDRLDSALQENSELRARCDEFVRSNLEHMLTWRSLKAKLESLEGEVATLGSTNDELSLRIAATQARSTQLTVRLEGLGAQLEGTKQQLQAREAQLAEARAALSEKDASIMRWEQQVKALEAQLVVGAQQQQSLCHRIEQQDAALHDAAHRLSEADQRLASKQRGLALLRADFVAQRAAAEVAEQASARAMARAAALERELVGGRRMAARTIGWRVRAEVVQMRVEDLETSLARQAERRGDLVAAYWPVVARLHTAQQVVARLMAQLQAAGHTPEAALPAPAPGVAEAEAAAAEALAAATGINEHHAAVTVAEDEPRRDIAHATGTFGCGEALGAVDPAQQEAAAPSEQQPSAASDAGVLLVPTDAAAGAWPGEELAALRGEHERLSRSWLLLQDEYWALKERAMSAEVEVGRLRARCEAAEAQADEASSAAAAAQAAAASSDAMRAKLERDLVGVKAWVRTMEGAEQRCAAAIREAGTEQEARAACETTLHAARDQAAVAIAALGAARAEASALTAERAELLRCFDNERRRSARASAAVRASLEREITACRAEVVRLQTALDLARGSEAALRLRVSDAEATAGREAAGRRGAEGMLAAAKSRADRLARAAAEVAVGTQALQARVEAAERRVVGALALRVSGGQEEGAESQQSGGTVVRGGSSGLAGVALDAAALLDSLQSTLQCFAADATPIADTGLLARAEALIGALCDALLLPGAAGHNVPPAAALPALHRSVAAAARRDASELRSLLVEERAARAEANRQLSEASAAIERVERAAQLRERAMASLRDQLRASEASTLTLRGALAAAESTALASQAAAAEATARADRAASVVAARDAAARSAAEAGVSAEAAMAEARERAAAAAAAAEAADLRAALEDASQAMSAGEARATAAVTREAEAARRAAALEAELGQARVEAAAATDRAGRSACEAREARRAAREARIVAAEGLLQLADVRLAAGGVATVGEAVNIEHAATADQAAEDK